MAFRRRICIQIYREKTDNNRDFTERIEIWVCNTLHTTSFIIFRSTKKNRDFAEIIRPLYFLFILYHKFIITQIQPLFFQIRQNWNYNKSRLMR